jgi:RimJ/RimL family protein N-acetyltransferase
MRPSGRDAGDDPVVTDDAASARPTLTGERVLLRPWRPQDVDAVLTACQDPEIQRWTQIPVPYGRADAEAFVGPVSAGMWAGGGASFAVEPVTGGPLIGSMGLFAPSDGWAEAGYWTAPIRRGQGYTAEALSVLTTWALGDLGLRRVELVVDPANGGSRRVAERAGFGAEGLVRQRFLHRGEPSDVLLYARLAR